MQESLTFIQIPAGAEEHSRECREQEYKDRLGSCKPCRQCDAGQELSKVGAPPTFCYAFVSSPAHLGKREVGKQKIHNRPLQWASLELQLQSSRLFQGDYPVEQPGLIYDFLSLMWEQRGSAGPSCL